MRPVKCRPDYMQELIPVSTKMVATFKNHSTGQPTTIELRGDMWGGSANLVIEGGPPVAQISRQLFNSRELFTDKQTVSTAYLPLVGALKAVLRHLRAWGRPRPHSRYLHLFRRSQERERLARERGCAIVTIRVAMYRHEASSRIRDIGCWQHRLLRTRVFIPFQLLVSTNRIAHPLDADCTDTS